jgi:hypothetical protein
MTDDLIARLRSWRLPAADKAADALEAQARRIAELEAALKPFADKCEYLEGMYPPYENDDWTELTMDCLRAARAAYRGEKNNDAASD